MQHIKNAFTGIGGQFITAPEELASKLKTIKAFVFDWDGVFNDSSKTRELPNGFTEADSMGLNLLRYEYYYRNGHLPLAAIISGEENPTAIHFAKRESFFAVYFKMKNKAEALKHLCAEYKITPAEIAWFYDDVLDLVLAKQCGARFYLARKSQPLTTQFVLENNMADYITAHDGGQNGLRECAELIIALNGNFDAVLNNRMEFSPSYAEYFAKRNEIVPSYFSKQGDSVQKVTL